MCYDSVRPTLRVPRSNVGAVLKCTTCSANPYHRACTKGTEIWLEQCPSGNRKTAAVWSGLTAAAPNLLVQARVQVWVSDGTDPASK